MFDCQDMVSAFGGLRQKHSKAVLNALAAYYSCSVVRIDFRDLRL